MEGYKMQGLTISERRDPKLRRALREVYKKSFEELLRKEFKDLDECNKKKEEPEKK